VEMVFLFYNIFTLQESFTACWADFVEVERKDAMEKASMGLMEEITGRHRAVRAEVMVGSCTAQALYLYVHTPVLSETLV
jgi:hypothetical protein